MHFSQHGTPHHSDTSIRQSQSRGRGIDLSFPRTSRTAQLKPRIAPYLAAGTSRLASYHDSLGASHIIPDTTMLPPEFPTSRALSPASSALSSLSSECDDETPNRLSCKIQQSSTPLKMHDLIRNPQRYNQQKLSISPIPQDVSHQLTSTTHSDRRSTRDDIQSQRLTQQRHMRSKQVGYKSLSLQLREAETENARLQKQIDELEGQVEMAVEEEQFQAAKASEYRISFEETF